MGVLTDDFKRKLLELSNPHITLEEASKPAVDPHRPAVELMHDIHHLGNAYDSFANLHDSDVHNKLGEHLNNVVEDKVRKIYDHLDKNPIEKGDSFHREFSRYMKKVDGKDSIVPDALGVDFNAHPEIEKHFGYKK